MAAGRLYVAAPLEPKARPCPPHPPAASSRRPSPPAFTTGSLMRHVIVMTLTGSIDLAGAAENALAAANFKIG